MSIVAATLLRFPGHIRFDVLQEIAQGRHGRFTSHASTYAMPSRKYVGFSSTPTPRRFSFTVQ